MIKRLLGLVTTVIFITLAVSILQAQTDATERPAIIFVKQTPVDYTVGTISDIFTNVQGADPRSAQPVGGGLFRLDPDGTVSNLTADFGQVAVRDPEISFDGIHVLFSMKIGALGKWQIYEMAVDGSEVRQITDNNANNWDAAYLSDGRLVYLSDALDLIARRNDNLPAGHLSEGRVHIMNADGSNSQAINFNPNGSFNPILSQSGQIIFTQWDLRDLRARPTDPADGVSYSRFLLWEMMSDGSREGHPIFGAHLVDDFGGGFMEVRELLDGSGDMLATFTQAQYTFGAGAIVRFTPRGAQDAQSFEYLTDDSGYSAGRTNFAGRYRSPYPMPDGSVIASYADGTVYDGYGIPDFDLVMLNEDGTHTVLHSDPDFWDWQAVAVVARTAPQMVEPLALDDSLSYAIVNTMDVELRNRNAENVVNGDFQPMIETGSAAFVRLFILTRPPAPYAGGDTADQIPSTRLLGTVPVEADGSFAAIVPASGMLLWDVVDADGNVLVTERTWQELVPGEIRTCGGCHTPDEGGGRTTNIALNNPVNLTTVDVDTDDNGLVDLLESYYEITGQQ
ncbi:MAG: hypothetical protein WBC91_01690 [Phototrophicaceae bacterium]